MHLTSHIIDPMAMARYIAHYRSSGSCQTRFEFLSQFRKVRNAFEFRNTGTNAFAKNQTRLAYEDKRDLYCICVSMYIKSLFI